jgi:hypothetical protein
MKPEALECNFCDDPIQDSIQNTDTQQPIEQQQLMGQQPVGQYQYIDQLQPMGQHQPIDQLQPMGQHQYMGQQQPMDQVQPVGQQTMDQQQTMLPLQPMGQQPMGQHQPIDQQPVDRQPIDQQHMEYKQYIDEQLRQRQQQFHEKQQSMEKHQPITQPQPYGQNPSYQQPAYQQTQQSYSHNSSNQHSYNNHSHNQQSSGQHAYDESPQYAPLGHVNTEYLTMGGVLLFFVILFILDVLLGINNRLPHVFFAVNMLDMTDILQEVLSDGMITAMYVNAFAQILDLGRYVLFAIAIVQIFMRKSAFLRLLQLNWLIVIFASILHYVAGGMVITELRLVLTEAEFLALFFHPITGFTDTIGPTQTILMVVIVLNIGFALLFTWYFSRSNRVQTFMRGEEYKRKALFAFNRPPA